MAIEQLSQEEKAKRRTLQVNKAVTKFRKKQKMIGLKTVPLVLKEKAVEGLKEIKDREAAIGSYSAAAEMAIDVLVSTYKKDLAQLTEEDLLRVEEIRSQVLGLKSDRDVLRYALAVAAKSLKEV